MELFEKFKIILASESPRRRELLSLITDDFDVIPSKTEEKAPVLCPEETVKYLSLLKAVHAAKEPNSLGIGADTIVYADGIPMGKPKDEHEAFKMLRILSGRSHEVFTGVTVINTSSKAVFSESERTIVHFAQINDDEIRSYISTGEPMDKAGAYGIQGYAAKFILGIEGCYYNVVGLPVRLTYLLLKKSAQI